MEVGLLKILILGDIVGKPGRNILMTKLSGIQAEYGIDFTIANAENAAGGRGLTRNVMNDLIAAGVEVMTMGNHVWDNKDIFNFVDDEERLIRPANYPGDCPGQGYHVYTAGFNTKIAVINVSGRVFLPALDCPFKVLDDILEDLNGKADYIIVDFHAEATSEKLALAYYLDGRVSAVVGTHTHIQTADESILPEGTAYITDLGMTGPQESILGMEKDIVIQKFLTGRPARFEVAKGKAQIQGIIVEVDDTANKVLDIKRVSLKYDK